MRPSLRAIAIVLVGGLSVIGAKLQNTFNEVSGNLN